MELSLLGPLAVTRDGVPLQVTGPKRRALLTLLALEVGRPVTRDHIIDALWPTRPTGREDSTLRVHVSHLRDALEPDRGGEPRVLLTRGSAYLLAADMLETDIERFDRLAARGRGCLAEDPEAALATLTAALDLWRGRPLQDVEYEDFAQAEIRRLEAARVDAIEDRADALVELGQDLAAIEDLELLLRVRPTRERPVCLLMRALYRTGRQADALRVARRHARALAEQGLDPSPRVDRLQERILTHDPALLPDDVLAPADLAPGRSVRGYELREEVGSGTVGTVYRAFQASVGRHVALKAVHPHLAELPEFVRRFAEQARVVASLEHPHIVPLYDFWRDPAGAYLVMRWLDGGTLADRLGRPWHDEDLARVIGDLADAMGYAHGAGVLHRDVRPANVLFDGAGHVHLCDFGLAVGAFGITRPISHVPDVQEPYAAPEQLGGEPASVASDVFALGVLLAEAATGAGPRQALAQLEGGLGEVVRVATAPEPADRYPDMAAFRSALLEAVDGTTAAPPPRRVRRNPYKGLEAFAEVDRADFHGRDDVVETLVDLVDRNAITAIVGASGSGKSSVVMAGLVPQLRDGALPGSDEWSVVRMVPGADPFEEFHVGLRAVAVGGRTVASASGRQELREAFSAALDGPRAGVVLVVDQFEELFSSQVDETTRERFLDNLVDLASDPARRVRIVLTLRADFSDRPLAHPRFGDLLSRSSLLLAPMPPEQLDEVIRRPASRAGVQVEPGLVAEIVRDVSTATAYLPLLQYVLSELFERRTEDRLSVRAYRALGGVQGVLERRAEATFAGLRAEARAACRQLFLRLVHVGEVGQVTRRRLPLTELHGLGQRAAVDEALAAFAAARLLTHDRDPVTRTPTVEVAHETVIERWARFAVWIEEARADLLAHARVAAAATTWARAGEDPAFLLTGGPLVAAEELVQTGRIDLNALETRLVAESRAADDAVRRHDQERRQREVELQQRSRRRLAIGVGAAALAVVVGVVAAFAWVQGQRANELAVTQERQSTARRLAAAAVDRLSSDPELGLLLALAAAELSLDAQQPVLPEVVDALHRSVISPRPDLELEGARAPLGGRVLEFAPDGSALVVLADDGGVMVTDPRTGRELGRLPPVDPPPSGVVLAADGRRVLTTHDDAVRVWDWPTQRREAQFDLGGVPVAAATVSRDGAWVAAGGVDGTIRVWRTSTQEVVTEVGEATGRIMSLDFDPIGSRIVAGGEDGSVLVWNLATGEVTRAHTGTVVLPIVQAAWHPVGDVIAVTTGQGENLLFDARTGERLNSFGNGQHHGNAIAFDASGSFLGVAGTDGFTRIHGTWVGGEAAIVLPAGGAPTRDVAFDPVPDAVLAVATIGSDGRVRVWRDLLQSERPIRPSATLYPQLVASRDGRRYVVHANELWLGVRGLVPTTTVVDAATGETLDVGTSVDDGGGRVPAITTDGASVAFAGRSGDVEILNVDDGATMRLRDSAPWTVSLAFSDDGALLAGGATDGSIRVWDATRGVVVQTLQGHGDRTAPDGSVPSDVDGDPRAAVAQSYLAQTAFRVDELAFRPGGTELASAGFDGTVRVWDPETGEGRVLRMFDREVSGLAYSSDGALLATADRAGDVRVLDATTGEVVIMPEPLSGPAELVFAPDGRHLAGAGPGPVATLWDMETGRITRRFHGAIYRVTSVGFVNDGTELRVMSGEGIDRGYVLDPEALVDLARAGARRELTDAECRQYLRRACEV